MMDGSGGGGGAADSAVGPLSSHLGNHSAVVEEEATRERGAQLCLSDHHVGLAYVNQSDISSSITYFFNRVTTSLLFFSLNFLPFSPSLLHTSILSALHANGCTCLLHCLPSPFFAPRPLGVSRLGVVCNGSSRLLPTPLSSFPSFCTPTHSPCG